MAETEGNELTKENGLHPRDTCRRKPDQGSGRRLAPRRRWRIAMTERPHLTPTIHGFSPLGNKKGGRREKTGEKVKITVKNMLTGGLSCGILVLTCE